MLLRFRGLWWLVLLFPAIEIYGLYKVGSLIGAIPAIGLLVFSAVLGVLVLNAQGGGMTRRVQQAMAQGQLPAQELLEGVVVSAAALLLLIPGFVSDVIALLLLLPPVRKRVARSMLRQPSSQQPPPGPQARPGGSRTLEGEFWRDDER